ncbi:MAG: hypothetical protein IJT16_05545 [Lachnospiraceae bacterium]|nr:hypothetical protein [Lachnospiraceae bacterium]
MKKEYLLYLKNYLKKESFYIDILSVILGILIIAVALTAVIGNRTSLLKAVFGLSLFVAVINACKGFLKQTPTKLIYAGISVALVIVWIFSLIRL